MTGRFEQPSVPCLFGVSLEGLLPLLSSLPCLSAHVVSSSCECVAATLGSGHASPFAV